MSLEKPIVELGKAEGQWHERVWYGVATYSLLMAVTAAPGLLAHTCPEHPPGLLLYTVSSICFAKKGLHRDGDGKGCKGGRRQETGESDSPCPAYSWKQVSERQGAACYRDPWEPCRGLAMLWVRCRKVTRRDWPLN